LGIDRVQSAVYSAYESVFMMAATTGGVQTQAMRKPIPYPGNIERLSAWMFASLHTRYCDYLWRRKVQCAAKMQRRISRCTHRTHVRSLIGNPAYAIRSDKCGFYRSGEVVIRPDTIEVHSIHLCDIDVWYVGDMVVYTMAMPAMSWWDLYSGRAHKSGAYHYAGDSDSS
jgi:hypothetical protein